MFNCLFPFHSSIKAALEPLPLIIPLCVCQPAYLAKGWTAGIGHLSVVVYNHVRRRDPGGLVLFARLWLVWVISCGGGRCRCCGGDHMGIGIGGHHAAAH